ncbi:MAG: histidine--tRNA ligase [Clostridiales Family XIII bacterium]|jgi:histidyl-tRNA synthetase|nr:histidine--tRNA ligase [Clostridiales Family XIII bacterium]
MLTKAPKGTKDILPGSVEAWQYLEKKFFEITRAYGFNELRTPTIEHTELFQRGVGETTDVVEKQMYTFEDYGHRSITLRPEGTAGAVRAYLENKIYAAVQPTKYSYEINCFRYEKPQSGRLREFHQFGIELFGSSDMLADAEVIALANDFLRGLGLKKLELHINSIGCPTCRAAYRKVLQDFLRPNFDSFCDTCKVRFDKNPMRILDCKSPECQKLVEGAPVMLDYLCDDCKTAFEDLKTNLTSFDVEYVIDPGIVRGLDYYTKTAFEFVSTDIGAQGTVCGGGRYDNLIEELGGPSIPGVGFGLGIERLLLVLQAEGIELPEENHTDAIVIFLGDAAKPTAIEILNHLRKAGLRAIIDVNARGMKGQFKYADKSGAKYAIILGDEELETREANVKDLVSGEQCKVAFESLTDYIK